MALRLRDYNQPTVWRQTLFIALQANQDKEVGLDIFRLMRATGAMQQRPEYAEYAALATEAALPGEVVSLTKAGKQRGVRRAEERRVGTGGGRKWKQRWWALR